MGWQHSRSNSVRPTTLQQRSSWRCCVRCSASHHCCDESNNSRPKSPRSIAECAATTAVLETLSHVNAVVPSWSYRTCGFVHSDVWPEQGDPILYCRCSEWRGLLEICRAVLRSIVLSSGVYSRRCVRTLVRCPCFTFLIEGVDYMWLVSDSVCVLRKPDIVSFLFILSRWCALKKLWEFEWC